MDFGLCKNIIKDQRPKSKAQQTKKIGRNFSVRFFSFVIIVFEMKKFYAILPLVLVFVLFSCQPKTFMNIDEIPLPPEAKTGTIDGRYEIELDAATGAILTELKKNYPQTQERIMFLPDDADAARIFEFYASQLTEKGFTKDADVPLQGKNYRQNLWKKTDEAVSIAVIEAGKDAAGKPIKFLAIHTGAK